MREYEVDLTNCDREPIHIPGKIQPHGFLVAVNGENHLISYISENVSKFTGTVAVDFLGKSVAVLEEKLGFAEYSNQLITVLNLAKNSTNLDAVNPYQVEINQVIYYIIISQSDQDFVLEFEPAASDLDFDIQKAIGRSVSEILSGKNLTALLENAAQEVKKIIDYDRVLVYRFNEEGHGEVVAETKEDHLEAFLGLHYPSTDIPKQARELYKINFTRLIADVNDQSAAIITFADQLKPLDLTHSCLRAVSPIHIQYLKNMGVSSSFSISLVANNELWGLIACHNYSPRFINYKAREASKLIGQILSSALEYRQDEEDSEKMRSIDHAIHELSRYIKADDDIISALISHSITLKDITDSSGVVLIFNNSITRIGETPDETEIRELSAWVKTNSQDSVYYNSRLPEQFSPAKKYSRIASGIMACMLSRELNEMIIWFKPEKIKSIKWAGDPEKPLEESEDGIINLSPRKSFEMWTQIVKNTSERWTNKEITTVIKIREEIIDAINRKANEIRQLNERLQLAYDELDTFSYTISHDLRTPLSAIKSYSELLIATNKNLDDNAKRILDRIVAGADKMNFLIKEILNYARVGRSDIDISRINMANLLTEIKQEVLYALKKPDIEFVIGDTPDILGDKVMITQVFINLLHNAVKYSSNTQPQKVKVEGNINNSETVYSISDNGVGIDINYHSRVFELFKRMDNVKDYEGTGVGLAIVKRIVEKHDARIWFESKLGIGTVFYISFKN